MINPIKKKKFAWTLIGFFEFLRSYRIVIVFIGRREFLLMNFFFCFQKEVSTRRKHEEGLQGLENCGRGKITAFRVFVLIFGVEVVLVLARCGKNFSGEGIFFWVTDKRRAD